MAANDVDIRIRAKDQTQGAFSNVKSSLNGLKNAVFSVQGALAGLAGGFAVRSIVESNRSFQSLRASLITFTGSTEKATEVFGALQQFAKTTPFALEEVVGGFNKLVARGINPSIQSLTMFGNIAGGTGKTLDQFIEAVADAVTGEFERLKEFGIKARVEGDKVKMTFGGVTKSIGNNATEINAYLENLGATKFGGGMERQMETLNGKFSNFNDAVYILGVALGEAGFNKILKATLSFLTNLIERFTDATRAGLNFFDTLRFGFFGDGLKDELTKIEKEIKNIRGILKDVDVADPDQQGYISGLETDLENLLDRYTDIQKYISSKPIKVDIGGVGGKDATATTSKPKDLYTDHIKVFDELKQSVDKIIDSTDIAMANKFTDQLERLDNMFFDGSISVSQYDAAVAKLTNTTKTFTETKNPLKEYSDAIKNTTINMDELALSGIKTMEDALVGLVDGTMSAKNAFKDMARSIISDLARILIQKQITGPIADAFSGFFGGSPAPMKAIGGSVQAGQEYMVGERGAEMFVPNSSGSIIPNNRLGGGGGTIVNQVINVTTGVQQTVRAEIMTLMPQIANAAKSAVADANLRGGSYRTAMR